MQGLFPTGFRPRDARRFQLFPYPAWNRHGDALSASIAASIIAKTTRDAHMLELDGMYSGYGLASHKGYPTPEHCRLLRPWEHCPFTEEALPSKRSLRLGSHPDELLKMSKNWVLRAISTAVASPEVLH